MWGADELVPSGATSIDDVVDAVPDGEAEIILAEILPDVFNRVQFRTIGRQRHQGDIVGHPQSLSGLVPTRTVEHDHGMRARCDMEADLLEVQAHRFGIDAPGHKAGTDAACGADRAEQPDRTVALVTQPRRP